MSIGLSLGAMAGYFGGMTDSVISWLMNVIWSLPSLLLVIAISFALGKGFWQIFISELIYVGRCIQVGPQAGDGAERS
ncbi:hypothetical protein CS542_06265 [Pedobacter sp. IW39]|nr:hypothetical protein CS542_06265 [Pedobacter sp. IW39]